MLYVIDILSLAKGNNCYGHKASLAQNLGMNVAGGGYTSEQWPNPDLGASNIISL